jgi:hypothetical protein
MRAWIPTSSPTDACGHGRHELRAARELQADNTLWFFMSRGGGPVAELSADDAVNVLYAHPGKDTYVSVSGHARAVELRGGRRPMSANPRKCGCASAAMHSTPT